MTPELGGGKGPDMENPWLKIIKCPDCGFEGHSYQQLSHTCAKLNTLKKCPICGQRVKDFIRLGCPTCHKIYHGGVK